MKKVILKSERVTEKDKMELSAESECFFFSTSLIGNLTSDYISLKILYNEEPLATMTTIFTKIVEIVEKTLKLYLIINKKQENPESFLSKNYGHSIENLRNDCSKINNFFNDKEIVDLAKNFSDKSGALFQYFRYGNQKSIGQVEGNLKNIMPIVDKIYFKSLLTLPEEEKQFFISSLSLRAIINNDRPHQFKRPQYVIDCISINNMYFDEFLNYCKILAEKEKKALELYKISNQENKG